MLLAIFHVPGTRYLVRICFEVLRATENREAGICFEVLRAIENREDTATCTWALSPNETVTCAADC